MPLRKTTRAQGAPSTPPATGARRGVPPPTEDEVFDRIYQAVLDHRLEPGTKLKELAMAEAFGVNRGLVRKVLARLAYAKLIELRPNRGATVARPSVDESRDLFAARRAVEGAIVDTLARRVTSAQARRLRTMAVQERDAYDRGEARKGLKMSLEFHRELATMAGNRVLGEMLDHLIARTPLVVLAFRSAAHDNLCSNDEHGDIVEAIAAGNAAGAVAAMARHLQNLEDQLDLSVHGEPKTDLARLFAERVD